MNSCIKYKLYIFCCFSDNNNIIFSVVIHNCMYVAYVCMQLSVSISMFAGSNL